MDALSAGAAIRYSYPPKQRIAAWVGLVVFSAGGAIMGVTGVYLAAALCAVGCLACGVFIISGGERFTAQEEGLTCARLWREDLFFAWADIAELRPAPVGGGILLKRADRQRQIIFDHLRGYTDLVERLLRRRPDLFPRERFRLMLWIRVGRVGLLGLFLLLGLNTLARGDLESLAGSAILLVMALWITFDRVQAVETEPGGLQVRTGFKRRFIPREDILGVELRAEPSARTARMAGVRLVLREGKALDLFGFAGGEALVYGGLMLWWEERK
jgi:hypothetical protein